PCILVTSHVSLRALSKGDRFRVGCLSGGHRSSPVRYRVNALQAELAALGSHLARLSKADGVSRAETHVMEFAVLAKTKNPPPGAAFTAGQERAPPGGLHPLALDLPPFAGEQSMERPNDKRSLSLPILAAPTLKEGGGKEKTKKEKKPPPLLGY